MLFWVGFGCVMILITGVIIGVLYMMIQQGEKIEIDLLGILGWEHYPISRWANETKAEDFELGGKYYEQV